jgi:hypothetical protein
MQTPVAKRPIGTSPQVTDLRDHLDREFHISLLVLHNGAVLPCAAWLRDLRSAVAAGWRMASCRGGRRADSRRGWAWACRVVGAFPGRPASGGAALVWPWRHRYAGLPFDHAGSSAETADPTHTYVRVIGVDIASETAGPGQEVVSGLAGHAQQEGSAPGPLANRRVRGLIQWSVASHARSA